MQARFIVFAVLIAAAAFATAACTRSPENEAIRWLRDDWDVANYWRRGAWWPLGCKPYQQFSEYPQLATYWFALPHILSDRSVQPGWVARDDWKPWAAEESFECYRILHMLLMLPWLAILVWSTADISRSLGGERPALWILFLPASLYMTLMRYDVMPSAMASLAISLVLRQRPTAGLLTLGAAVLTKWYPIVLGPALVLYIWHEHGKRALWPIVTSGLAVGAVLVHSVLWVGWESFLSPYRFHAGRSANIESFFFVVSHFILGTPGEAASREPPWLNALCGLLQFAGAALPLAIWPTSQRRLVAVSAAAVIMFVTFPKFFSPQWLLWISPLVIPLAQRWELRAGLVAMDLATYLFFPVIFDATRPHLFGTPNPWLIGIVVVNIVIKCGLLVGVLWTALKSPPETSADLPMNDGRGQNSRALASFGLRDPASEKDSQV